MKRRLLIVLRLTFFPSAQAIILFVLLWLLRSSWVNMVTQIEKHNTNLTNPQILSSILKSEIEKAKLFINRSSSSATNIVKALNSSNLNNEGTNFDVIYSSPLDVFGVQMVYGIAFPESNGLIKMLHKHTTRVEIIMVLVAVLATISAFFSVSRSLGWAMVETGLRSGLARQMEATRQAERKSMNKTLSLARATHDVRASLAGIVGLVHASYTKVNPGSELHFYLTQIESCTNDLLGLLNSILDSSRIESGKVQLEEKEFDVAQLLEETVNFYYPVAEEKEIDMILDPCDGSLSKFSHVKGDRVKLKQILSNLLSNAIKFTSEGHVAIRAWATEPELENPMISSSKSGGLMKRHFFSMFCDGEFTSNRDLEAVDKDPNRMSFVFEIDDTGKGIPKEKHKAVFEDYVQVKETSFGHVGTGLGLGIVQSLVRLMHGEIGIEDKEMGEKGSCFRFNVVLSVCDKTDRSSALSPKQTTYSPSPSLFLRSPKANHESLVVLLLASKERRRVLKKFMESHGIVVLEVERWKKLPLTLAKITKSTKLHNSSYSSESVSDLDLESYNEESSHSSSGIRAVRSIFKKSTTWANNNITHNANIFVLIVIEVDAGPISKISKIIAEFRSEMIENVRCRVVWVANLSSGHVACDTRNDVVQHGPFHGTRLYEALRLLPQFGGDFKPQRPKKSPFRRPSRILSHNDDKDHKINLLGGITRNDQGGEPSNNNNNKKSLLLGLDGKRFLVVEDTKILGILAAKTISSLGGIVEICTSGEKAIELVRERLAKGTSKKEKHPMNINIPYDYILMDCEMPGGISGSESCREIRRVEERYGVRVPIIGLSGHSADSEEANNCIKAGMDSYMCKPLNKDILLQLITQIES